MILSVDNGGCNFLESFTRRMFYKKESSLNIILFSLSKEATVFSDVGFTSIDQDAILSYEFPLTDSHYIAYAFTNLDTFIEVLEKEKGISLSRILDLPKKVRVKKFTDDLARLKSFNVRMVEQSWKHVFSKTTKPFIL